MSTMTLAFYHPDRKKLVKILDENKVFNLQLEFKREGVSLSQRLLIWEDQDSWMLTDLGDETTYRIPPQDGQVDDEPGTDVYRYSDNIPWKNPKRILAHLQKSADPVKKGGTHEGVIDLLKMLNLDDVDVEALKRSDEFDFERVHRDLSTVHAMLREIPASPRERLLSLPREHVEIFSLNLQEFYEKTQAIKDFGINSGKDLRAAHANLLHEISDFCDRAKAALGPTITHLKAQQVDELESQVNATFAEAVQNLNAEVDRTRTINAEAEAKEAERQKEISNFKLEQQNQRAKKSISHYKQIFANQADKHHESAQGWLRATIGLTFAFGIIFAWLLQGLGPAGSELASVLQNLLTKGFFLSLIYLLLNRCIKNYTAEKHLETVNRHRQNALETFDVFVAAAKGDRETRDAVLLAATNCIFDANQSGYLSAKTSRSESASPIPHVVKAIFPGKSPPGGE